MGEHIADSLDMDEVRMGYKHVTEADSFMRCLYRAGYGVGMRLLAVALLNVYAFVGVVRLSIKRVADGGDSDD